ncbi:MAG TPA: DUF134 domain-containing protein [Spirochaetota bacterium]|nr:DUF134 domain-containing protein [Spirochaetota bacterium]HOL56069.1 DUF134 domain-containing protein [Spirochaetota bacterium]HPP03215.1 DUF134 domain-containing protein [Spirochaetota bacterium]
MPRCKKKRCCRFLDSEKIFKPAGIPFNQLEVIEISLDEFEAIRLCDYDKLSQIGAAGRMNISRGTIQRLLESGRYKIVDALLNNKILKINNIELNQSINQNEIK